MTRRLDPRLAAGVAVVLVGGVLLGILTLGRLHYPEFPSLLQDPDPAITGSIAYLRWSEGNYGTPCVWVVEASGRTAPRELRCARDASGPVEWRDGHVAVTEHDRNGVRWLLLDPVTGEVVREEPADGVPVPPQPPAAWSGDLHTEAHDGTVGLWIERDGERDLVASTDGPRDYHWWVAASSPDGDYAVVADSAQRLLIVRLSDGLIRLLVTDAADPAWGGTPP